MTKTILIAGTYDTKDAELSYLAEVIRAQGGAVLRMDVGVLGDPASPVEITKADGEVCEVCMWLADSADERGRGLMGVTSLGTPEGMAFVWEQPTAGAFLMFQTVTPLSIAWFGDDGALVSTERGGDAGVEKITHSVSVQLDALA